MSGAGYSEWWRRKWSDTNGLTVNLCRPTGDQWDACPDEMSSAREYAPGRDGTVERIRYEHQVLQPLHAWALSNEGRGNDFVSPPLPGILDPTPLWVNTDGRPELVFNERASVADVDQWYSQGPPVQPQPIPRWLPMSCQGAGVDCSNIVKARAEFPPGPQFYKTRDIYNESFLARPNIAMRKPTAAQRQGYTVSPSAMRSQSASHRRSEGIGQPTNGGLIDAIANDRRWGWQGPPNPAGAATVSWRAPAPTLWVPATRPARPPIEYDELAPDAARYLTANRESGLQAALVGMYAPPGSGLSPPRWGL